MTKITTTHRAGSWRTDINEDGDIQSLDLPLASALYVWGIEGEFHPSVVAAKELAANVRGSATLVLEA